MPTETTLDDVVLQTLDGAAFPLARLKGRESVFVLMRHLG